MSDTGAGGGGGGGAADEASFAVSSFMGDVDSGRSLLFIGIAESFAVVDADDNDVVDTVPVSD